MTKSPPPDALLVAIDFSEPSLRALDVALGWKKAEAEVTAVHVVDATLARKIEETGVATYGDAIARIRARAEKDLADALRDRSGVESMIVEGEPFTEIIKIANDLDCDLIVIGSRGTRSGLRELLFGSTAEKVLRGATRPVLCVP
jgi:nucleotide-binding universal stress UspA family protein